jgi:proteasome accessory factor B
VTQTLAPRPPDRTALVLVRETAGQGLRRHAHRAAHQGAVPSGWERLEVTYGATDSFADEVLGYGADVIVEAPEDVRSLVVNRLREAAAVAPAKVSS